MILPGRTESRAVTPRNPRANGYPSLSHSIQLTDAPWPFNYLRTTTNQIALPALYVVLMVATAKHRRLASFCKITIFSSASRQHASIVSRPALPDTVVAPAKPCYTQCLALPR